jgi:hypothetical protein
MKRGRIVAKKTGSALIILLVSLLVTYVPSPAKGDLQHEQNVCIDLDKYEAVASIVNPGAFVTKLGRRDVATFQYNYNNTPPHTEFQLSGVIFSTRHNISQTLIAIFIKGCLAIELTLMPNLIVEIMKPVEGI